MGIKSFLFFLILISEISQIDRNSHEKEEIDKLINIVKHAFNISSIEYEYNSSLILNPQICGGEETPINNKFIFKYQNGNFLLVKQKIRRKKKITSESDTPSNLIEFMTKKYHERSTIYKGGDKDSIIYTSLYFYKGKGAFRHIYYEEDNPTPTIYLTSRESDTADEYSKYGAARYFLGYIGFTLDASDSEEYSLTSCPCKKITELLDIPGETHLRKEENYRVLFHYVKSSCDISRCTDSDSQICKLMEEYKKCFSFEVWIDESDNIIKIVEIDYLPIIYGEDFVQKICGYNHGRFFPYEIRRVITFENFLEFPSGVKVPLKANVFINRNPFLISRAINYEDTYVDNVDIIKNYKDKKITAEEFRILSHCYGSNENNYFGYITLEIVPETLKVNQPIPESTFMAPKLTVDYRKKVEDNEDKQKEEKQKKFLTLICFFLWCFLLLSFLLPYLSLGNI